MRVAVIGGGAAGLTAAGSVRNAEVVIFEHSEKVGKKIYITGKGRCNFTNVCDVDTFLSNVVRNPRFLYSALKAFTPVDAVDLLEKYGCKTKIERGRRAFPLSDKASDVIKALKSYAISNGAEIRLDTEIDDIVKTNDGFSIISDRGNENFDRIIFCTGGLSYPSTGSDGSSYGFIKKFGHTFTEQTPSLIGLNVEENISKAEGLTLKNVTISADGIKPLFGDMLITRTGISGPIVLTLSALAARREKPYKVFIDLKPKVTAEELDSRILKEFDKNINRQFKNALDDILPKSFIPLVVERVVSNGARSVNSITCSERAKLVAALKKFELTVISGDDDHAVVTAGGVNVKEIDPKSMESKLIRGLFFAGEVIDVDALTGGYNLHIAFSTGYCAGKNAGRVNE